MALDSAAPAADQRASGRFFKLPMNFIRKYIIYINSETLDEALEETLQLAYLFGTRALQEHRSQGRNGEYETFAVELLALLQKYRYLYTVPPEAPKPDYGRETQF